MDGQPIVAVDRERSAPELLGAAFKLYRRYSWLFLILAAVVVVPYSVISLVAHPGGPLHGVTRALIDVALQVGEYALVIPLVSVLHLYAVEDLRAGREPAVGAVARRGIASLRVVSLPVLLSWIGIFAGFIALIVPGVILAIRWAVVAQTAALEATGWRNALDRSAGLTERQRGHVFWFFVLLWLITTVPFVIHLVVFGVALTVGSFVVSTAFDVVVSSFTALATALPLLRAESAVSARPRARRAGRDARPPPGAPYLVRPLRPAYRPPTRPDQLERRGPAARLVRRSR